MLTQPRRSEIIIIELIEEIIKKAKQVLHAGQMKTSFEDFQRNRYSVNDHIFGRDKQEQLTAFYNRDKSAYNTDALTFLRTFHLQNGLGDPCKVDYLIARLNQNCFHYFITLIQHHFIKIQEIVWMNIIGKQMEYKVYGDAYVQKLIFIYPISLFNTTKLKQVEQLHAFTLTIEIILNWRDSRFPNITHFTHKFQLTEEGKQIEILVGSINFPLQTYIDFLFREIYNLSPEILTRINAR